MEEDNKSFGKNRVVVWMAALLVSLLLFYAVDHMIMSMQGLPLGWDLTPS